MIKVDSEVKGLKELEAFLRTLPDDIAIKMLRSSLMGAAKPIMLQAQDNVLSIFGGSKRYSGTLEMGIVRGRARTGLAARVDVRLKRPKKAKQASGGAKAGNGKGEGGTVNGVKKKYGDDPYYGRWLELGRAASKTSGAMPARPFLRTAGIARQDDANREFSKTLQVQIAKWCKKNGVEFKPFGAST